MIRPAATLCTAVCAALTLTAACSGSESAAPTSPVLTAAPSTSAPATATTRPLFGSLGSFVAAFSAITGSGAIAVDEPFVLTEEGFTTSPLADGGTGFVSVEAVPSGVIGGILDADGAVTALFVFLDPLTATAAPAVTNLLGTTIATPAEFDQAAFATEYRQLALDAAFRAGDQTWQPSTNGSGHSLVTSVVEGAADGNNLIEVAIVGVADEAAAKAAVRPIRNEVIGLLAD